MSSDVHKKVWIFCVRMGRWGWGWGCHDLMGWLYMMVKLLQNHYFLCQNWGAKKWFVLTLTEAPQREVIPDLTSWARKCTVFQRWSHQRFKDEIHRRCQAHPGPKTVFRWCVFFYSPFWETWRSMRTYSCYPAIARVWIASSWHHGSTGSLDWISRRGWKHGKVLLLSRCVSYCFFMFLWNLQKIAIYSGEGHFLWRSLWGGAPLLRYWRVIPLRRQQLEWSSSQVTSPNKANRVITVTRTNPQGCGQHEAHISP